MSIKDILFAILKWQVCDGDIDPSIKDQLDRDTCIELYRLSHSHDLAHVVAKGLWELGVCMDEQVGAAFKKQQMLAVLRHEKLKRDLTRVCKALEDQNVGYTPLKGSVLREFYREPWMRTSCDIDILVSKDDLEAARDALIESMGCEYKGIGSHDIQLYAQSGTHIELHYTLTEAHNLASAREVLEKYREYLHKTDTSRFLMSDELFYFYHIDHAVKHFQNGGCGIKPFLDLWVLENRVPHEFDKRESLLKKGGLDTFAKAARRLMGVWFEDLEHTELTRLMEEYILSGGVYGTVENSMAVSQNKHGGKFKYVMYKIFLPCDQLKYQYPVLEKHRWMLPFAQVARWLRLIFGGGIKRSVKHIYTCAAVDTELLDKTKVLLSRLGIAG